MAPADAAEEDRKKGEEAEEDTPVVKELKAVDDKYLELEREYEKEVNELMRKYTARQQPFLEERRKILTTAPEGAGETFGTPALRGFWLKAMQHHPAFQEYIQQWDEPVLEYLVDIEKSNLEDDPNKGFKLRFTFSENPYFTNTELWKEYHTEEANPYNGDLDTKKIVVNEIEWKSGKNVTVEKVAKKVKGGGAKKAKQKGKEKEEPRPSYFRSFHRALEPGMKATQDMIEEAKEMYDDDEDEDDDDDDEIVDTLMENDYEAGCALRDNVIPFAVRWYTGEAAPEEDEDDFDEEDEEEEDDDDEDEDEEEDEPAPKSQAKGKSAAKKKGSTTKAS